MLKYVVIKLKERFPMYKILIVDDEAKIREVIREYAEFSGYEHTSPKKVSR